MADESLKDFLRQQARSLDSLLELTPAKHMFGEDVSDQWKRKKQTTEQKMAARMAKLDPANWKSAKDVYDERAAEATKKRKREEKQDEGQDGFSKEASKNKEDLSSKKRKLNDEAKPKKAVPTEKIADRGDNEIQNTNFKKRSKKRAAKKGKNEQRELRKEAKNKSDATEVSENPAAKADRPKSKKSKEKDLREAEQESVSSKHQKSSQPKKREDIAKSQHMPTRTTGRSEAVEKSEDSDWSDVEEDEEEAEGVNGGVDQTSDQSGEGGEREDAESTATSSEGIPDILSPPLDSAASSVSSIIPPATAVSKSDVSQPKTSEQPAHASRKLQAPTSQKSDSTEKVALTETERLAARQRLQDQIESFRSQRKADENTPRSRAELLEQRRRKEEERKAVKKAQRQKEREEEAKRQDEEMARRFSPGGSGSLLGSPRSPLIDTIASSGGGYSYGRIAFEDGSSLDPNTLSDMKEKRHKGPQDAATALKAAEAKQARLAGLDQAKRADIAEKDMWLNAKKRAHGEKVRDDQSLLKKALKRQEKQKSRSGTEWNDRIEGVRSAQEARQKKRTDNIQKRKDEKFAKKTGTSKKKVKRPGFEGSFRGRTGKGKKSVA